MEEPKVPTNGYLSESMTLGEVFAKSGMFPDIKTASQALVKILAGKELGLTPFQSMASIYIVNGRLGITANAMATMIKKSNKYDFSITKISNEGCEIDFFDISDKEDRKKIGTSVFTKDDAAKSGLINKETYKSWPRNMYFSRALSNGARWFAADAIAGYYEINEIKDIEEPIDIPKTTISIDATGEVKNEGGAFNEKGEAKLSE